jgi:hypothetical protein
MRISLLMILLITCLSAPLYSQGVEGKVMDTNGDPVPYAAIFIKELTRGTTCNALGLYSLPLPEGDYTIYFRSLGYTEVTKNVRVDTGYINLAIQLPPQTYMIPEVRISATGEDPAYWIMRKTIGLANYHLNEVSSYQAEIYIKGAAILRKIPKVILKRIDVEGGVKVKEDEAYMLESLNEVGFEAPDNYTLRVIASQNTLPGYADNVNPMDYVNASLYQQEIEGIISPLARSAFSYYKFEFVNSFMVGTHIINKIKVIPKRKSQQLVAGYLYIVEDLYCLHSSDLTLNTMAGTLSLQQQYANVIMDAWLPVSHKIQAEIDIIGVKGTATYVSSMEYSDVVLNPNLPETYFTSTAEASKETEQEEKPVSKKQEQINELLVKEELTNREAAKLSKLIEKESGDKDSEKSMEDLDQTGTTITVAEDAVKNDSLYWNKMRAIPLTPKESLTLKTRDSIIGTQIKTVSSDSGQVSGRKKVSFKNLVYGRTYVYNRAKFRFTHDGLLDLEKFGYNTVDGIYYGQGFRVNWRPDSLHVLDSKVNLSYAFMRHAPLIRWDSYFLYAPLSRGKLGLDLNYRSLDFNRQSGIPNPTNLVYTLFLRENHLKMYEQINATIYNMIDPLHGLILTTSLGYGVQNQLENTSLFSFFYRNEEEERFTENTPAGRDASARELQDHKRFEAHIELEYTPERYYIIRNYRKVYRDSKWPTFSLAYRRAIPLEESGWSDYSMLEAKIRHSFDVGLLSKIKWSIAAGTFIDSTAIHFSDYKHFKSNPLYIDMAGLDRALMFSDYYQASTNQYWANFHATLTSSYLLIKYLPWFSERLWQESLDVAYLFTPQTPNYLQLGYRLEDILFLMDLGVYVGFRESLEAPGKWGYEGVTFRLNFKF